MNGIWQWKTLGEVCKTGSGGTPLKDKKQYYDKGTIPWLMSGEVAQRDIRYATKFITQQGLANSAAKLFPENTVLVAMYGATAGQVGILRFESTTNQAICGILPSKQFIPEFLFYFLQSKKDELVAQATGNAQPNISQIKIRNTLVPIVEISEQSRIVAILDKAFEGITTAKANAEKNLQNARAIFESQLQSVFSQASSGWEPTTLGREVDILAGFAFKSARYSNAVGDIRLLRGDNVMQGFLRWEDVKRWPANATEEYERYWLREGDVVLAMDRPWVKAGLKHATITSSDLPSLLVQRTARIRGGANIDNRFLKLLIGSPAFISHILGVQTGIGVPHISAQQVKAFSFARPPLTAQRGIANSLEDLRERTGQLSYIYERKLSALDALKQSLLHCAFAGELTADKTSELIEAVA